VLTFARNQLSITFALPFAALAAGAGRRSLKKLEEFFVVQVTEGKMTVDLRN
jgi:hypothetical protein